MSFTDCYLTSIAGLNVTFAKGVIIPSWPAWVIKMIFLRLYVIASYYRATLSSPLCPYYDYFTTLLLPIRLTPQMSRNMFTYNPAPSDQPLIYLMPSYTNQFFEFYQPWKHPSICLLWRSAGTSALSILSLLSAKHQHKSPALCSDFGRFI